MFQAARSGFDQCSKRRVPPVAAKDPGRRRLFYARAGRGIDAAPATTYQRHKSKTKSKKISPNPTGIKNPVHPKKTTNRRSPANGRRTDERHRHYESPLRPAGTA